MFYDLSALSPSQFESLSADLIGRDLALRFEQFGDGPDGGIDGRHATGTEQIILQSKHYDRSGFPQLERDLLKERTKIDGLDLSRYILSTSVPMTPARKAKLMAVIGPTLIKPGDIYGKEDLEGLLRNHQDIAEAHPALWQASGRVIESVLHRTLDARERLNDAPPVLQSLLPKLQEDGVEVQGVNGGVKPGQAAAQKSATLCARMRLPRGRSPSGGLMRARRFPEGFSRPFGLGFGRDDSCRRSSRGC